MAYTDSNGFTPDSFNDIFDAILEQENIFVFDREISKSEFLGSAEGNIAYSDAQTLLNMQVKFAQVYEKLQSFIQVSNEKISVNGVSYYPLIRKIQDDTGLSASIAPATPERTGLYIALDYDDAGEDDENRPIIANSIFEGKGAGIITYGDISQYIAIEGQAPALISWEGAGHYNDSGEKVSGRGELQFRMTITISRNTTTTIASADQIKELFESNFNELNKIGQDIEPEKYFEINRDAPYAANILTEYSEGGEWKSTVKTVDYFEKYNAVLATANIIFE